MAKTKAPVQREITMAASLSGLTEEQAQEFQNQFKVGFQTWLAIALVAHVLVFAWRRWRPANPLVRRVLVLVGVVLHGSQRSRSGSLRSRSAEGGQ